MKAQAVGYWICTVLIGLSFLSGGAVHLLRAPQLLPRHVATGDDVRHILTPLVLAALIVASWALRPEGRKLGLSSRSLRTQEG